MLASGTRLGPFEIVGLIGTGGMGEVYRAQDTRLNRPVAIKVLRPEVAADADRLQRFEQEARAASALNHPNVLTIYDVGRDGSTAYFAMEWVEGQTLRALMTPGRLPMRRLVEIAPQIADGLAKAHAAGIVHRDLKPENVMVTPDGLVKIVDFGLAKLGAGSGDNVETVPAGTAAGVVMGTVGYMSPEQASGLPVDYRSDQFALGLMLYEMTTGKHPFRRESAVQTMVATIEADPVPVHALNPDAPAHLVFVIDRCLRKAPNERYDSTRDLARDLEQVRQSSSARSGVAAAPVQRNRRWAAIAAIAGVAAVLAVGAAFWLSGGRTPATAASPLVAVRAFKNLSANGGQDHFAVGMTEEVRGQLSKISALRLLSGAAAAKFGDNDLSKMVDELDVTDVVYGSVRLDQNRVRVSVELVDARTGQMRWSDQYEREIADVFAVQSEIALRVARTLRANFSAEEQRRVEKPPTSNMEAYDLYLKSQRMVPLTDYAKNAAAMEMLNQALALDPRFAMAKARLAYRTFYLHHRGDVAAVDRAIVLAREAEALDPTLAYPHFVLGSASSVRGLDAQARAAHLRALELDPSHTSAMANLSFHEYRFGRLEDSLMWARRMFALSDRTGNSYYHVAAPMLALRDDGLSWRWVNDAARRAPPHSRVELVTAYLEFVGGDGAAALARLRRASERWPGNEEMLGASAELAHLIEAPDADRLSAAVAALAPDMTSMMIGSGARVRQAYLLKRRGDARWMQEVDAVLKRGAAQLAAGSESTELHLDLAAVHAIKGAHGESLDALGRALKHGYREYAFLVADPIFAPLRSDTRFVAVIDEMKADVARQRQRALARGLLDLESLAPGIK